MAIEEDRANLELGGTHRWLRVEIGLRLARQPPLADQAGLQFVP
jgi:hypothetical protein